jgi:hypothetical protein
MELKLVKQQNYIKFQNTGTLIRLFTHMAHTIQMTKKDLIHIR